MTIKLFEICRYPEGERLMDGLIWVRGAISDVPFNVAYEVAKEYLKNGDFENWFPSDIRESLSEILTMAQPFIDLMEKEGLVKTEIGYWK